MELARVFRHECRWIERWHLEIELLDERAICLAKFLAIDRRLIENFLHGSRYLGSPASVIHASSDHGFDGSAAEQFLVESLLVNLCRGLLHVLGKVQDAPDALDLGRGDQDVPLRPRETILPLHCAPEFLV